VVRLVPLPERVETLLAAFPSVRQAAEAVGEIIGAGIIPAALEMMDRIVIEACERCMDMDFPKGAEALLLAEVDGGNEETLDAMRAVRAILERCGASEVRVAADAAERAKLWKARKGAFAALAEIVPDYYTIDGTIPRRCLPEVLDYVFELAKEYGLTVGNVFHAGDGNIHPCIFYDSNKPGTPERSEELGRADPRALRRSGRHDHGRARRRCREAAPDVRAIPRAGDRRVPRREARVRSDGNLNPGKASRRSSAAPSGAACMSTASFPSGIPRF
jgi:glycolate oxidase